MDKIFIRKKTNIWLVLLLLCGLLKKWDVLWKIRGKNLC